MRVRHVVLPQQVLTVVVAVGRAHDGVNVLAKRYVQIAVPEDGRSQMIELDQDHGALDSEVINGLFRVTADPGEVGLVEMRGDLRHTYGSVTFAQIADP